MALTTFRTPISAFDIPTTGSSISGETHYVPVTAPYEIRLDRIPKVIASATSWLDNIYVDVAGMIAAGISFTVGGHAGTITNTTPAEHEGEFQITDTDYPFSTKVTFNVANKGEAAVFAYTGYMSPTDSKWSTALHSAVDRLEEYPSCAMLSTNERSSGRFDNTVADTKTVYVCPSKGKIKFTYGLLSWAGGVLDLTSAGDTQVTAFTDVDGYKRIGVYFIETTGALVLAITESAESATLGGLVDPAPPTEEYCLLGYVNVRGDGTGNAGGITVIAQTAITWSTTEGMSNVYAAYPKIPFLFRTYGPPVVGEVLDVPLSPGMDWDIERIDVYCGDTGTAGDDLVLDVQRKAAGGAWASVFDLDADKPTIPDNTGVDQTTTEDTTNMNTEQTFDATDMLQVIVDSMPPGCLHVSCIVWGIERV
jgi:hypothetical protein